MHSVWRIHLAIAVTLAAAPIHVYGKFTCKVPIATPVMRGTILHAN
jgi:hypothetical protein